MYEKYELKICSDNAYILYSWNMEVSSASSLATQDKNISSYLASSDTECEGDSNDALKHYHCRFKAK